MKAYRAMSDLYPNEERRRLAAVAHARACGCPRSLADWEERVADRCCARRDILEAIQHIDLDFRAGLLKESEGIKILRRIEIEIDEGGPLPPVQPWFAAGVSE